MAERQSWFRCSPTHLVRCARLIESAPYLRVVVVWCRDALESTRSEAGKVVALERDGLCFYMTSMKFDRGASMCTMALKASASNTLRRRGP
jgi:hypothetical protein